MNKRKYAIIDEREFPIVKVVTQEMEPTLDEFKEHLDELSLLLDKYQEFVLILDISKSKFLPSNHRLAAGEWLKRDAHKMRMKLCGFVFLNNNILMNVMLKCVLAVAKPAVTYTVVSSEKDAMEWAERKLVSVVK